MTIIKTAKKIKDEYLKLSVDSEQPRYVPLQEYEALRAILQQWVDKADDGIIDDTFNGVRSPELTQLITATKAALGE